MIRVSVMYPAGDDTTFDHDYYKDSHVPKACAAWNVGAEIDKGINGPNVAAVHFFFDSLEQMQTAMATPATAEVMADVANYTNITPVMQISEVV
ncbi:MAG TPA: EthD family reductase [Ilumatobacteraceae bacterium]|nr:EthD family reductase [Ilumatobacteraceae bacterium]